MKIPKDLANEIKQAAIELIGHTHPELEQLEKLVIDHELFDGYLDSITEEDKLLPTVEEYLAEL